MQRTLVRSTTLALLVLFVALAAPAHARQDAGRGPMGADLQRIKAQDGAANRFRPAEVTIERGTRVRWVNTGDIAHTTTSNTDLWDELLSPGESFTRRFRRAGTFWYHCEIHPEMTGTITVT